MIPELVGRLPVTVALDALDEKSLVRILKEPKNALTKQYTKLFGLEEVKITFDEGALTAIATKALKRGTGARGLRAILEEVLMDVMFDLPEPRGRRRGESHRVVHHQRHPAAARDLARQAKEGSVKPSAAPRPREAISARVH